MNIVNERIKERRLACGKTLLQVADYLGVKEATAQRYESGAIKTIKYETIVALAKFFNCDPSYLMGWEDSINSIPPGFDPLPATIRIPLIGSIACGEPITAEENIEDYVDAPEECRPDFALRCRGESMVDAGIENGDIVYIKKQPSVENGEIAAVRIGDEATLKYVQWDGTTLTLIPANKKLFPKSYTGEALKDIHIEGKAVGFTHWF